MELPTDLEENLSDDYEEGEILDGDNLYEEVSSLEEFRSSDEGEQSEVNINTSQIEKHDGTIGKKFKQCTKHRRKDHKCKENSVCRKERKGKHCYARIRKAKSYSKVRTVAETSPQSTVERIFPRKPDVTPIIKHLKCRPTSPYKTRPDPPSKILHRYDYKDYHEKENRHNNKRYWATPPRSKLKPPEKHAHYNRNKITKDNHYSKSRHQAPTPPPKVTANETSKSDPISKTSLLKRLVGSGATGVKPIKENESAADLPKSEAKEISQKTSENSSETDILSNQEVKTDDCQKSEPLPEPPKKIEVKWIRSMKEDKDELHLRVEALRSAWVKKFNDRKKKGLIHQKKSEDIDDFLEDFAFGSDIEDENTEDTAASKTNVVSAENNTVPYYNATDISGDILKTEDMVIVNDKNIEETIICETAVATTEGYSSVFVDPLFFSGENFPQNVNVCHVSDSNCINFAISESNSNVSPITTPENSWKHLLEEHTDDIKISSDSKLRENNSNTNSNRLRSKRIRWRKKRKSKTEVGKTIANISADLDEEVLRELALLSVKTKNRNMNTAENEKDSKSLDNNSTLSVPQVKITSSLCESGSGDFWEDDMDEDILRAKLLSSLTKQVSEESAKLERATAIAEESLQKVILVNSKISTVNSVKPPASKKQTAKKLDRRKMKNSVNKKVWKQGNTTIRNTMLDDNITVNHYGIPNVFNKNDKKTIHIQQNNAVSNVRPIPQVPQMIITVNDSDSSSDLDASTLEPLPKTEPITADIEANIDLLLREAVLNSQLEKGVIDSSSNSKPDDKEDKNKLQGNESVKPIDNLVSTPETIQTESKKHYVPTPTSTSSSSSCSSIPTPQALKHLPAWQQEEYKRLKKKIAEKEKVLQVTRSKIIEPAKDINANNDIEGKGLVTKRMPNISRLNSPMSILSSLHRDFSVLSSSTGFEKVGITSADMIDNSTSVENSNTSEAIKNSKVEVNNATKMEKICSTEESNTAKKCLLMSCSIMEEINVMNDIVNDFEKNNSEYMDLIQKTARLKRILKATESKMAVKKKRMFQIRDTISEKERLISSKISTFSAYNSSTPTEKTKPPNRDVELVKLKHKEVCLRAQFLFHDFLCEKVTGKENEKKINDDYKQDSKLKEILPIGVKRMLSSKETIPIKKKITAKDSIVVKSAFNPEKAKDHIDAPLKRNFSGKEREREEWDPNTPVCHYDLNGICRDEECQYQHFKIV